MHKKYQELFYSSKKNTPKNRTSYGKKESKKHENLKLLLPTEHKSGRMSPLGYNSLIVSML